MEEISKAMPPQKPMLFSTIFADKLGYESMVSVFCCQRKNIVPG
jgi:hypothetical protein